MDSWIRQEHARSESDRVQNKGIRRSSYEHGKGRMDWVFVSKDWLLDWYWVADKETAMCLQGLRELYYGFSFHSLVLFFVFLD